MFAIDLPALNDVAAAERWRALGPVMPEDGRPEMDEYGELFLAPLPTNRHQRVTSRIGSQIETAFEGEAIASLAIITRIGVRVPDMCWTARPELFQDDPAATAPEICVEVASPGNTQKWLLEKAAAYLDAGALEAVIVELDGRIRYFDANGERPTSVHGLQLHVTF